MKWIESLLGRPGFFKHDDCYALNRGQLWIALSKAIETQQSLGRVILVVCHFADTFTDIQEWFGASDIHYQIESQRLSFDWIQSCQQFAGSSVSLLLADLIDEQPDSRLKQPLESKTELAIMVCERHPLKKKDRKIERLGRAIPVPVELGYFLALDDAIVNLAINETTLELMKQMGLENHELVSSNMVTRRLDKVLGRIEKQFESDLPADSAEEWLRINASKRESQRPGN